jgi:2-methylcitrate dehydratase
MPGDVYNPLPRLIDFASRLRFEDLPASVVHETVRRAVDSLATALGGLSDPRLVERWRYLSQRPIAYEAGGWAYGVPRKLSLCDAAFLNSTMTRWLDYNDTYLAKEPAHPSDNLGLLFAMSGTRAISGRDFITAAVLAYDVQCRLCEAASLRSHGWDHVNYILLSASLAGARLLGFDATQMYNAVAFALSSNGAMRQAREGTYLSEQKNMAAADAVRGAAWALEKVLSGSDGPAEIIEGKHGLVAQMSGPLDPAAFDDLGEHFLLADTYIKPFPVEYHGQTVAEHALAIREKLGAPKLADVAEVVISGYEAQRTIIGDESKRRPATKETADHSLYYAFAATLLEGTLSLRQYRPEMLHNPDLLALIERTQFVELPEWTQAYYAPQAEREFPSSARVRLVDGRTAEDMRHVPLGHPKNPMSDAQMEAKFRQFEGVLAGDSRALLDALWHLDTLDDVSSVMPLTKLKIGD